MKRIITVVVDDLTGEDGATSHWLEIDGYRVEIDLTDENYEQLLEAVGGYLDAGRRVANGQRSQPPAQRDRRTVITDKALRAWWKANLGTVESLPSFLPNGRVPGSVFDAWARATNAA